MHPQAKDAIKAARNWTNWGRYAAMRFCKRRNIPARLVILARTLNAMDGD